jgi:triosephosphate isomerase
MNTGLLITPPFFEVGPKVYTYGSRLLKLALYADELSLRYGVKILITPQYVDIPLLSQKTKQILIFAQHMDPVRPGRGVGAILPEALKEAGAHGVMLNHAEKKLPPPVIEQSVVRAKEVGLATMVCADNLAEAETIACLKPDIIIVESPDRIEGKPRSEDDEQAIRQVNEAVWRISPATKVLHGAGINSACDVYKVILKGAQGTGSTSAIFKSDDPEHALDGMIKAVRQAWDKIHQGE